MTSVATEVNPIPAPEPVIAPSIAPTPKAAPPTSRSRGALASSAAQSHTASGNISPQFDLQPYSRPVVSGFGYSGFVQAQYVDSQLSEDQLQQGNIPLNRDQFSVRSARLRLEQGYEFTAFGLELDASTTRSPILSVRRAEATVFYRGANSVKQAPLVALSAGVIDLPFGFEVAESVRTRVFMERSIASSAFFPTQNDVGVRLFGAWRFARYAFALVNGEPFNGSGWPSDPNARKDLVGRLGGEGELGKSLGISAGASFAFGKGFHAGRPATKDSLLWRDDNEDGMAQASEVVGVPGSSASKSANFERFALGIDLELQLKTAIGSSRVYGEAYVASNHDRALFISDPVISGFDVRQLGGYIAISQEITQYAFIGLRADLYDPNTDFFESRRGEFVPETQKIVTWSPTIGAALPSRARIVAQYDFVRDYLGRNKQGVPSDARNNQLTVRLQVEL
jgi:hypothetical protein